MLGNFKDDKLVTVLILLCHTSHYTHRVLQTSGSMLKFNLFRLKYIFFHFELDFLFFEIREMFWYYLSICHYNSKFREMTNLEIRDRNFKLGFMFSVCWMLNG
jgi:hypothetical protein